MNNKLFDKKVLIIPHSALGDLTIYLRIARNFTSAGAIVSFQSNALYCARQKFPWLSFIKEPMENHVEYAQSNFDLVIAHQKFYTGSNLDGYKNVAYVCASSLNNAVLGRDVHIREDVYSNASRPIRNRKDDNLTMVQWADLYCLEVFGISSSPTRCEIEAEFKSRNKILIFPLSAEKKKDYWLFGFKLIAQTLIKLGWDVEFICAPNELSTISQKLKKYTLKTFNQLDDLIDYVAKSSFVISNDSGGGHIASLCDVPTFTISRKEEGFHWRPGFNEKNTVLSPFFRLKVFGKGSWRFFIPFWKIIQHIGRANEKN